MFPRALAKHMVLLSCSKTSIAVFGMLIAATVKDPFSRTAVSRRHHSRVQMKAIYSIKQLHHSSNVGGATQHNGWHRATGDIADTVEISKSSRISRPARQVIADQVATSGRSDGQGHHVDYRNAEAPADQLVRARARQSARLGYLMSSTQAIRKRLLDAGVSFGVNANIAEYG